MKIHRLRVSSMVLLLIHVVLRFQIKCLYNSWIFASFVIYVRGLFRTRLNIYDGTFCEVRQWLLAVNYFRWASIIDNWQVVKYANVKCLPQSTHFVSCDNYYMYHSRTLMSLDQIKIVAGSKYSTRCLYRTKILCLLLEILKFLSLMGIMSNSSNVCHIALSTER